MSCILHIRSKQGEIMILGQEKCNEQHVAETFPFHVPVVEFRAFSIFPEINSNHSDSPAILALCARNLISYLTYCTVQTYPEIHQNQYQSELEQYFNELSKFLLSKKNLKLFIQTTDSYAITEEDTAYILQQIPAFPVPPSCCHDDILWIFNLLKQIICAVNDPSSDYWKLLYNLSAQWQLRLSSHFPIRSKSSSMEFWLLSSSRQYEYLSKNYQNAFKWGREFDQYYRDFLAQGFSDISARGKARKKFIENHPVPKTDDELLNIPENSPGLTAPAVRRYHRIYLDIKQGNFS